MSQGTVITNGHNGLIGSIINSEYRVVKKLGGGSFGDIYLGIGIGGKKVAIKCEAHGTRCPQLRHEYKVYRELQNCEGIGTVSFYGVHETFNVMVMDLLGLSLEDLFVQCDRQFSLKTVLQLADQFLERIDTMHSKHLVHRDVKPANFVLGLGAESQIIYSIDFGLSSRYRHPRTLQHIPYREGRSLTGTPRFASINNHLGLEQSRRDDLESIGYVLIYFLKGSLPWQGLKARSARRKYKMILEKKQAISIPQLCENLPQQFVEYLAYCRSLKFEAKPNILYLRGLFRELYKARGYGPNSKGQLEWDWSKVDPEETLPVEEKPQERADTEPEKPTQGHVTSITVHFRGLDGVSSSHYEATHRATAGTPICPSLVEDDTTGNLPTEEVCVQPKPSQHKYTYSLPAPLSPGRNFHRSGKSTVEDISKSNEMADQKTRHNDSPLYCAPPLPPSDNGSRLGFATMPGLPREQSTNLTHKNHSKWSKWGMRLKPKSLKEYFLSNKTLDSKKISDKSPRALDSGLCTTNDNDNQYYEQSSTNAAESKADARTDHQIDENWNSNIGVLPNQTLPSIPTPGLLSVSSKFKPHWWSRDGSNLSEVRNHTARSENNDSERRTNNKRINFKKIKFISRSNFKRSATSNNVVN